MRSFSLLTCKILSIPGDCACWRRPLRKYIRNFHVKNLQIGMPISTILSRDFQHGKQTGGSTFTNTKSIKN